MNEKCYLNTRQLIALTNAMLDRIDRVHPAEEPLHVFPVPRGGVPVAYLMLACRPGKVVIDGKPETADVIIDDIIDTGRTYAQYTQRYKHKPFEALINKRSPITDPTVAQLVDKWVVFPWESTVDKSEDDTIVGTLTNRLKSALADFRANRNIGQYITAGELDALQAEVERRADALLRSLLIDVDNDHNMRETAKRMAKMYMHEIFNGRYTPSPTITTFPNAAKLDEIYTTGPITLRSTCAHHLCPIIGKCWIGILPSETTVVGLSKFNRVVAWLAARPQIQEELVVQIADTVDTLLKPKGVAVIVEASHTCLTERGVRESRECVMTNSVMRGTFRSNPAARAEVLALLRRGSV